MSEKLVVKRNGEVVPYDIERIAAAIKKAVHATEPSIKKETVEQVITDIDAEVHHRFDAIYPNVENIQDIVEKHLMRHDLFATARAYIVYRESRKKEREARQVEVAQKAHIGKLTIIKRDGSKVLFDSSKVSATVIRAQEGCKEDTDLSLIVNEAVKNIYDGASTAELEKALILAASTFIELDPAYSRVAAHLFLQKVYKEVMQVSVDNATLEHHYRDSFISTITQGIAAGTLDARMKSFNVQELAQALRIKNDSLFEFIGIQTLYERYFLKKDDKRLELPQSFWMRIAMGLALNEENREARAIEFYSIMSNLSFIPSTPTLFHAGTARPQLSSCYITTVKDDLKHIFKSLGDNANYSKWSGGLGNDWTNIRGTGAHITSTGVKSQGVIPFLKIANDVTMAINRSGKRRGATCAYLETWHYDFEDFLDLRRNTGDERRRTHDMNTANWIPDLFMKRVKSSGEWTLFSPDDTPDLHHLFGRAFEEKYCWYESQARSGTIKVFKTVDARTLWRKMLTRLYETGHPWITFKDPCNVRSPQDHAGVVHSSNLCTEITLNTSFDETAVCNLGSVNIAHHVTDTGFDREKLSHTIGTAMRMLDNVIDLNFYPADEARNANLKHRPVGLGIMGLQDALFKLKISFEESSALTFCDAIMEFISYHAILASSQLAKERGTYHSYDGSKWSKGIFPYDTLALLEKERGQPIDVDRYERLDWTPVRQHVREHGMRNSNTMAIAPTATIATIAGCYPSIEPIYKNIYVKANISGEFTIVNKYLINDLKRRNLWNRTMLDQIKYHDGNLDNITEIPDDLRKLYREAFQISPIKLINLTAERSKWIDQSQSHNVFMMGTSGKQLDEIYMHAWEKGLKTTYYLRTLAASQIEKSTLDAKKFGFTQKRQVETNDAFNRTTHRTPPEHSSGKETVHTPATEVYSACSLLDPECESCQ